MIGKRIRAAAILLGLGPALGSCSAVPNGGFSGYVADHWPHWAGGMPEDVPPRPGTPGYEEFIAHGGADQDAAKSVAVKSAAAGAATPAPAFVATGSTGTGTSSKAAAGAAKTVARPSVAPPTAARPVATAPVARSEDPSSQDSSAVNGGLY